MFSSETIPRDMSRNSSSNFLFSNNSNNFKHVLAEGQFLKSKELMGGTDLFQSQSQQQQIQQSCGLARFRSAPGSFVASLLESTTDNSSSGDDSEALFSALMNNGPLDLNQKNNNQMQYSMKQEVGVETEIRPGKNGFSTGHMGYVGAVNGGGGAIVGSYSVGMESQVRVKVNNSNCSNLTRQSSSPAGFFSGFGVMGEVGNYRVRNHAEANSSASGLSNDMNFSSATSSTSRFMPSIPENGTESVVAHSSENGRLRNGNGVNCREYESGFAHDSWNDSSFNGLKRKRDGDLQMFSNFNGLENLNEEARKKSPGLVHHLSLPKTSSEMADVQKFLHFQQDNSVPCQIRAKRGFATHPRSIAERMRRSRISEKMKKLQDLFPNMDKQTNTADMLDLAVEYIKDLQKQVQTLTETRAKCICSSKPKPTTSTTS